MGFALLTAMALSMGYLLQGTRENSYQFRPEKVARCN